MERARIAREPWKKLERAEKGVTRCCCIYEHDTAMCINQSIMNMAVTQPPSIVLLVSNFFVRSSRHPCSPVYLFSRRLHYSMLFLFPQYLQACHLLCVISTCFDYVVSFLGPCFFVIFIIRAGFSASRLVKINVAVPYTGCLYLVKLWLASAAGVNQENVIHR